VIGYRGLIATIETQKRIVFGGGALAVMWRRFSGIWVDPKNGALPRVNCRSANDMVSAARETGHLARRFAYIDCGALAI